MQGREHRHVLALHQSVGDLFVRTNAHFSLTISWANFLLHICCLLCASTSVRADLILTFDDLPNLPIKDQIRDLAVANNGSLVYTVANSRRFRFEWN